MAECHQKLGEAEAQAIYARIVRDYGDQTAVASTARTRVASQAVVQPGIGEGRRVCAGCVGDKIKDFTLSPDGRWIGYTAGEGIGSSGDNDLIVRDLTNGETRRLVDVPAVGGAQPTHFAARRATWSPDMRQVAYQFRDTTAKRRSFASWTTGSVDELSPGRQSRVLVRLPHGLVARWQIDPRDDRASGSHLAARVGVGEHRRHHRAEVAQLAVR